MTGYSRVELVDAVREGVSRDKSIAVNHPAVLEALEHGYFAKDDALFLAAGFRCEKQDGFYVLQQIEIPSRNHLRYQNDFMILQAKRREGGAFEDLLEACRGVIRNVVKQWYFELQGHDDLMQEGAVKFVEIVDVYDWTTRFPGFTRAALNYHYTNMLRDENRFRRAGNRDNQSLDAMVDDFEYQYDCADKFADVDLPVEDILLVIESHLSEFQWHVFRFRRAGFSYSEIVDEMLKIKPWEQLIGKRRDHQEGSLARASYESRKRLQLAVSQGTLVL